MSTLQLLQAEREELVRQGKLSELALVGQYLPIRVRNAIVAGIPVLDEDFRPEWTAREAPWRGGGPNRNNLIYISVSQADLRDAVRVIMHRPQAYGRGILKAIKEYFQPATHPFLLERRRRNIGNWYELYDWLLEPETIGGRDLSVVLAIALPLLILFAVVNVVRAWRRRRRATAADMTMLFITITILYMTPMGILVVLGDTSRYRCVIALLLYGALGRAPHPGLAPERERCPLFERSGIDPSAF